MRSRPFVLTAGLATGCLLALSTALMPVTEAAPVQRRNAGRVGVPTNRSRLDTMDVSFQLTKEQKNAIKDLMDEAYETAAPIREGLTSSHAAIEAAIHGNKGQAEIDAATKAYAEQATAMAALEMKTLAEIMKQLDDEQRQNGPAVSSAFFMLRGAFIEKKWNDIPSGRLY